MRKKLALYGVVLLVVALAASSLASAASRSAVVSGAERTAKAADVSQGTLTIHRLLQQRLAWTRQLVQSLRFLDLPPAPPGIGTNTIIDEPDPAGYGDAPEDQSGDSNEDLPPGDVDEDEQPQSVQLG